MTHADALTKIGGTFGASNTPQPLRAALDFKFAAAAKASDNLSDPAVAEYTNAANSTPDKFKSFELMNCTLTTVSMVCTNWIPTSAGETAYADGLGFKTWVEGSPAIFYWFDGRDLNNYPAANYDKMVKQEVTLKLTSVTAGASQGLLLGGLSLAMALLLAF